MPLPTVGTGWGRWRPFSAPFLGFLANFAMVYAISSAKAGEKADGFSVFPGRRSLLTVKEERDSGKRGEIGQKPVWWRGWLCGIPGKGPSAWRRPQPGRRLAGRAGEPAAPRRHRFGLGPAVAWRRRPMRPPAPLPARLGTAALLPTRRPHCYPPVPSAVCRAPAGRGWRGGCLRYTGGHGNRLGHTRHTHPGP